MAITHYAADAATLRSDLTNVGIKEPMWADFQWTCKQGEHMRRDATGTFEIVIKADGRGYSWTFGRV